MKIYRPLWLVVCVLLAAVGAIVAFVASPIAVTCLFIYFAAFGTLLTVGFVAEYWERSSRGRMRLLVCGAVVGGSAGCAFIGFASLVGPAAFLPAAVVLASSPYVMRRYRRWLGVARRPRYSETMGRTSASARPHNASRSQGDLTTLTDEQLCQLWRASYLALLHSAGGEIAETVVQRQSYLDEFERRNRTGFAIWLASGPLASASPLPYLVGVPTINWDDLTREQD